MPGTNAKMTEVQALMGTMLLKDVDALIDKRRQIGRSLSRTTEPDPRSDSGSSLAR